MLSEYQVHKAFSFWKLLQQTCCLKVSKEAAAFGEMNSSSGSTACVALVTFFKQQIKPVIFFKCPRASVPTEGQRPEGGEGGRVKGKPSLSFP